MLPGEKADFVVKVPYKPKKFWLDKDQRVFAYFLDEGRHPKWFHYLPGQTAAAAGDAAAAAASYDQALEAKEPPPDDGRTVYYDNMKRLERQLNAWIELAGPGSSWTQGDEAAAEQALGRAQKTLSDDDESVRVLRARLEVRRGEFEKAYRRLRKGVIASETLDTSEAYVLLAIAAQKTGHADDFTKALKLGPGVRRGRVGAHGVVKAIVSSSGDRRSRSPIREPPCRGTQSGRAPRSRPCSRAARSRPRRGP